MDPPRFHVEDYVHDLFVPGLIDELIQAKAIVSEQVTATAASDPFKPGSSEPAPFEPIQPDNTVPKPIQTEGSGVPEQVDADSGLV